MSSFGPIPEAIKGIQHFIKLAEDHDARNILVSYYARMTAIQTAMKILPGAKPHDVTEYLMNIMSWLETTKKEHKDVEGIANDTVAQALIEDYTMKIYNVAYQCDCNGSFTKNVVKAYYTVGLLCEVLQQFGPLSEDMEEKGKVSKYRATYIHNMLKQGLPPQRINVTVVESDEQESEHVLTHDEINERRKLRGEDPLPWTSSASTEDSSVAFPNEAEDSDTNFQPEVIEPQRIIDDGEPPSDQPSAAPRQQLINAADRRIDAAASIAVPPVPKHRAGATPEANHLVASLDPSQAEKAAKYCKWAASALNYDDIGTAIENLERALHLCRYGEEKPHT